MGTLEIYGTNGTPLEVIEMVRLACFRYVVTVPVPLRIRKGS